MRRCVCLLSVCLTFHHFSLIASRHGPIGNPISKNTSIFACVFVSAGTCLLSRCLETVMTQTTENIALLLLHTYVAGVTYQRLLFTVTNRVYMSQYSLLSEPQISTYCSFLHRPKTVRIAQLT
jgi:hypothetical protein